jgi:hypothetical protein
LLVISAAFLGACGAAEDDTADTSTTGANPPPPALGGVPVECCFTLFDEFQVSEVGCTYPTPPICIDPDDPNIDTNQDGTLDTQELTENVCKLKCPAGPDAYPFWGPGFHQPGSLLTIALAEPYDGCMQLSGEVLDDQPSCDPSHPSHLDPFPVASVAPTHEGTLVAGAPSTDSDVTINGVTVAVDFSGQFAFFLDDCVSSRPYEQCDLSMRALRLDLVGTPVFGDYRVDEAALSLAFPQTTTVDFVCGRSECSGTFEFAATAATAIDMNLEWRQKTLSSGAPGGGGLLLSHGPGGLGGVTTLHGTLDLDVSKSSGTLTLTGSGSDQFGGDLASTTFTVSGPVERVDY